MEKKMYKNNDDISEKWENVQDKQPECFVN